MVYCSLRHDRLSHVGSNLRLSARNGGNFRLRLHADGTGIHCRSVGYSLRTDSSVLQDESRLHIRVSRGQIRNFHIQDRRMVFLPVENDRSISKTLSCLPVAPADGIRPAGSPVLYQCHCNSPDSARLHVQRRSESRNLDRLPQDILYDRFDCPLHPVHKQGPGIHFRNDVQGRGGQRHVQSLLFR